MRIFHKSCHEKSSLEIPSETFFFLSFQFQDGLTLFKAKKYIDIILKANYRSQCSDGVNLLIPNKSREWEGEDI